MAIEHNKNRGSNNAHLTNSQHYRRVGMAIEHNKNRGSNSATPNQQSTRS